MKGGAAAAGDDKKKGKEVDLVSKDKDWRGVVENELRCAENWNKDWGFLAEMNCKSKYFNTYLIILL